MNQRKRQHEIWDRQLTPYLSLITWCEICGARPDPQFLDKAHRLKRRLIGWRTEDDRLEYFCAAKLCRSCHKKLDEPETPDGHQIMFERITKIVVERRQILLTGPKLSPPFIEWDSPRIYNYVR